MQWSTSHGFIWIIRYKISFGFGFIGLVPKDYVFFGYFVRCDGCGSRDVFSVAQRGWLRLRFFVDHSMVGLPGAVG